MTLIHDEDGNPNDTYYNSHYLAPGWLPGYPTYSVHTAEDSYQGDISVTRATALSDNTVYAQLGVDLGINNVNVIAHEMGITARLTDNPSEAIGGLKYGVSALQMSDAYATLANGGDHVEPTIISKVDRPNGKTIYPATRTRRPVSPPGEAYAGTQTLETVLQYGTGTGANYGCPAAGKTGHHQQLHRRLVRRLHAQALDGRVGRLPELRRLHERRQRPRARATAARWRHRSGVTSCSPPPTATAEPSRSRRQYWQGDEYFGKHAVSAYVPPRDHHDDDHVDHAGRDQRDHRRREHDLDTGHHGDARPTDDQPVATMAHAGSDRRRRAVLAVSDIESAADAKGRESRVRGRGR